MFDFRLSDFQTNQKVRWFEYMKNISFKKSAKLLLQYFLNLHIMYQKTIFHKKIDDINSTF